MGLNLLKRECSRVCGVLHGGYSRESSLLTQCCRMCLRYIDDVTLIVSTLHYMSHIGAVACRVKTWLANLEISKFFMLSQNIERDLTWSLAYTTCPYYRRPRSSSPAIWKVSRPPSARPTWTYLVRILITTRICRTFSSSVAHREKGWVLEDEASERARKRRRDKFWQTPMEVCAYSLLRIFTPVLYSIAD